MTFSKKIVAVTAVAASGVMGFDMNASAGPDGASASMGGVSVSAGPDGAKSDMKGTAKSDTGKTLSPAAKAAAARIPKDKTAEEIAELVKKEQKVCKTRNAEAFAKKMGGLFSELGNMGNMNDNAQASIDTPAPIEATPVPTEAPAPSCPWKLSAAKYCDSEEFDKCLRDYQYVKVVTPRGVRFNFNGSNYSNCKNIASDEGDSMLRQLLEEADSHPYFFKSNASRLTKNSRRTLLDTNMDGNMKQPGFPGALPANEEMCLKQVKSVHAELCSADSAIQGSYLSRFSCDDAITVCAAAGVDAESMPQCMTSADIAGTVIGVLVFLAIISGAAYCVLKKKQQNKNATNAAEIDIEKGSSTVTIKVAARRSENGSTVLTLNVEDANAEPQKVCVQDSNGSETTCDNTPRKE